MIIGKRFYDSDGRIVDEETTVKLVEIEGTVNTSAGTVSILQVSSLNEINAVYSDTYKGHFVDIDYGDLKTGNFAWKVGTDILEATAAPIFFGGNANGTIKAEQLENLTISKISDAIYDLSGSGATPTLALTTKIAGTGGVVIATDTTKPDGLLWLEMKYCVKQTTPVEGDTIIYLQGTTNDVVHIPIYFDDVDYNTSTGAFTLPKIYVSARYRNAENYTSAWTSWSNVSFTKMPTPLFSEATLAALADAMIARLQTTDETALENKTI